MSTTSSGELTGPSPLSSAAVALWRPFAARARIALIIGHMRSGSTLLLHLLADGSNRLTCGERNAVYGALNDFDRLEAAARLEHRRPFRRLAYVIDQVNHDKFTPNPTLLDDDRVRCVFLIRRPAPAVASLLRLTATYYNAWSLDRAMDYYTGRLATIATLAGTLAHRPWLGLTYDDLVCDTAQTFARLQAFLELPDPLSPTYALQPFTGRRGDPSPLIRSGRIVEPSRDAALDLPAAALARATSAFNRCRDALHT